MVGVENVMTQSETPSLPHGDDDDHDDNNVQKLRSGGRSGGKGEGEGERDEKRKGMGMRRGMRIGKWRRGKKRG